MFDKGVIVMAVIVLAVLLGTVFGVVPVMNVIKFVSPFFMIFVIVMSAIGSAARDKLRKWQSTGRTGTPPGFGKVHPRKDSLFYKLVSAGYIIILILLAAYAHYWLALFWLVSWGSVAAAWSFHGQIRDMTKEGHHESKR